MVNCYFDYTYTRHTVVDINLQNFLFPYILLILSEKLVIYNSVQNLDVWDEKRGPVRGFIGIRDNWQNEF